jgi:hypothetical protein
LRNEKEKRMKANSTFSMASARPMAWFMAALVLALTFTCVRRAYAAVVVPNHSETTYGIAIGGNSPDFVIPATNSPVTITGAVLGPPGALRGIGHLRVVYATVGGAPTVVWCGQIASGGITSGMTAASGVGLCNFSSGGAVVLRTAPVPPAPALNWLDVVNGAGVPVTVVVEMTW